MLVYQRVKRPWLSDGGAQKNLDMPGTVRKGMWIPWWICAQVVDASVFRDACDVFDPPQT